MIDGLCPLQQEPEGAARLLTQSHQSLPPSLSPPPFGHPPTTTTRPPHRRPSDKELEAPPRRPAGPTGSLRGAGERAGRARETEKEEVGWVVAGGVVGFVWLAGLLCIYVNVFIHHRHPHTPTHTPTHTLTHTDTHINTPGLRPRRRPLLARHGPPPPGRLGRPLLFRRRRRLHPPVRPHALGADDAAGPGARGGGGGGEPHPAAGDR